MKEILIVSATKHPPVHLLKECTMIELFEETLPRLPKVKLKIIYHNTDSLPSVYNQFINKDNKNKIVVFCHDDALIEDLFLVEKLNDAMKDFDIIGLAGIKPNITLKEPALWHLMGDGDRNKLSGAVAHFFPNENTKRFMTHFGATPERTILLDGVLLAINVEKILESGLKFDESNPSRFHFYDLDFCLTANKLGHKYGTYPIWITHKSHGLTEFSEEFLKGQAWFLQKWNNK